MDLPANRGLLFRFNEALKLDSLAEMTATMTEADDPSRVVEGVLTISTDGFVVSFNPVLNLDVSKEYNFSINGARDLAGNPMAVAFNSTIVTSELVDDTGPQLLGFNPYDNAQNVPVNTVLTLDFDEAVDPTLLNDSNFYLYDNLLRQKVPGAIGISADGLQRFFLAESGLLVGRSYYLHVSNIRDLAGNSCINCGSYQRIDFVTAFAADETAPQYLASTVSDGSIDVPLNARLRVLMDEPIGPIYLENIQLVSNSLDVPFSYTLSSDRKLITITPTSLLVAGAAYQLSLESITDLSGNTADDFDVSFSAGDSADNQTGSILTWSIPNGANEVPLNGLLEIELSERVDPTTVDINSFRLYDNTENRYVAGSRVLSADGRIVRFVAEENLEPDHRYDFYVGYSPYLQDLAGNRIAQNNSRYFYTGGFADSSEPSLVLSSIDDGDIDVAVNSQLVVVLDERVGDACQPEAVLSSSAGDVTLTIAVASDRQTLTLTSPEALATSTTYSLALSNLCDYAGNAFSALDVLSFTTSDSDVLDNAAPGLVSIVPAQYATGVSVDSTIVMEFNEAIDATSRPAITGGGVTVLGEYSVSGNTLTFTPDAPLNGQTQYTVNLYYSVRDSVGNSSYIGYYYFTTEVVEDTTAPTLASISPVADAIDINPGATIRLTFSEPMNPNTVNSSNIALYANGSVITPSVSRSADGQQVSLTANMPTASVVSVILTDGLEDLSGNALIPAASSFVTGVVDTDTSRPSVARQFPTNGSSNLFDVDEIVLVMNDNMDASSLEEGIFVASDGVLVPGTLALLGDDRTIRFTADEPFAEGAYIQVFVESLLTDSSGNAAYDYDGYFRMGSTDELIGSAAYPIAYSPLHNQAGVLSLNPLLMVQYNEALDPAALGSARINLVGGGSTIPTTVSLDSSGTVLQVELQELLQPGTLYELQIDDITDSDGDTNTSLYRPRFTTAADAVEDDRQPMVLSMSPSDGSEEVGINVWYSVRFDEWMNPISLVTRNPELLDVQFSESNQVIRYQRQGVLEPESEVTEVVPSVVDLSGNEVVSASSTFTTAGGPDISGGSLTGSISGTVATNPVIAWVASEAIDPVSISSSGVNLYDFVTGAVVPATLSLSADGRRIEIVPEEALAVGRSYRYHAYYLRDLSGNSFSNSYINFTTGFDADVAEPVFQDATVVDGQVEVPTNARFNVRFNEPLSQLVTLGINLVDEGGIEQSIGIIFNGDRTIVTIRPNNLLLADTDYTLTVSGLQDISGNSQTMDYSATFTTAATADLLTGGVVAWSIPNGATDVPLNALLEVELSERVDSTSVNPSTLNVWDGTERRYVEGGSVLRADGRVLRFVPEADLEPDHLYYLSVGYSPYLQDLAGNRIAQNNQRYFYTGGFTDTAEPTVSLTSITDGSVDVAVNSRVVVVLDERVGDACQPEAVLSSSAGDVALTIAVASDRQTLTLTSPVVLATSTTYSLALSNLCDYAGNAFSALDVLSFTTSDSDVLDNVAPSLVSISPSQNATGVLVDSTIVMEFDEAIDATSSPAITGGGVTVLGEYSISGNILTFTPDAPLNGSTQYRINLYSTVPDFAGNVRSFGYYYFTTQAL